jgi:hypothetical protein
MEWVALAVDTDWWKAVVKAVMNLRGISCLDEDLLVFQEGLRSVELASQFRFEACQVWPSSLNLSGIIKYRPFNVIFRARKRKNHERHIKLDVVSRKAVE